MIDRKTKDQPEPFPDKEQIPKKHPVALYAVIVGAVAAVVLIVVALVDAGADPVDDGLDNLEMTSQGDDR